MKTALLVMMFMLVAWPSSCAPRNPPVFAPPTLGPTAPPPSGESTADKINRLERDKERILADLRATYGEARREHDDKLKSLFMWVAAVSALASLACVAGAIFLPVMKKRLLLGAAAFGVVLALAIFLREAVPYLIWVGLGLVAIGILVTLPTLVGYLNSLKELAGRDAHRHVGVSAKTFNRANKLLGKKAKIA